MIRLGFVVGDEDVLGPEDDREIRAVGCATNGDAYRLKHSPSTEAAIIIIAASVRTGLSPQAAFTALSGSLGAASQYVHYV